MHLFHRLSALFLYIGNIERYMDIGLPSHPLKHHLQQGHSSGHWQVTDSGIRGVCNHVTMKRWNLLLTIEHEATNDHLPYWTCYLEERIKPQMTMSLTDLIIYSREYIHQLPHPLLELITPENYSECLLYLYDYFCQPFSTQALWQGVLCLAIIPCSQVSKVNQSQAIAPL